MKPPEPHAKKKKGSRLDALIFYLGGMNCLALLLSLAPPVLPRFRMQEVGIAHRFPGPRYANLFGATNKYGQMQAWFKYKSMTCQKAIFWANPDPLAIGMSFAAKAIAKGLEKMSQEELDKHNIGGIRRYGIGGAILGCQVWDPCKIHAMLRCVNYDTLACVGLGNALCVVLAGITHMVVCVNISNEKLIKKKKKLKAAQEMVMGLGAASFVLAACGIGGWIGASALLLGAFRNTSYYPFPYLVEAGYAQCGMVFVQFLVALLTVIRRQKDDDAGPGGWAPPPPPPGGNFMMKGKGKGFGGGKGDGEVDPAGMEGGPPPGMQGGPPPGMGAGVDGGKGFGK